MNIPANVIQALEQAKALHRQGRLAEAATLYGAVLAQEPQRFEALHLLGLIRLQQGALDEAHRLMAAAVEVEPRSAQALSALMAIHLTAGRQAEALATCDRLLALDPGDLDTLYNRGVILMQMGRREEALAVYDRVLAERPDDVQALFNRGNVLVEFERYSDALASYDRALAAAPRFPDALVNRGNVLARLERREEALASFERALALRPESIEALNGRGATLAAIGRFEEAVACYKRLLAQAPDHVGALFNMGNALVRLDRTSEALSAYKRVLALRPDHVDTLFACGNALAALRRYDEAIAAFERALQLNPRNPAMLFRLDRHFGTTAEPFGVELTTLRLLRNRAAVYAHAGRPDLATEGFRKALELSPDDVPALSGLATCLLDMCDWAELGDVLARVSARVAAGEASEPLIFLRLSDDPALHLACARNFLAARRLPATPARTHARAAAERIRLAYLSPDFRIHPVAYLIPEMLALHDRDRFEVVAVSFGPDDHSDIRARIVKSVDQFHDLRGRSDADIVALLRRLEVDVAVDLAGHTEHSRPAVFASRPAPVQAAFLGYCGTTAADFIDYVIADAVALPFEQQPCFTEKIVHLPDTFMVLDSTQPISSAFGNRSEAGLPEQGFVFCCFNKSYKVSPAVFDVWMAIMREADGSVLWLTDNNDAATTNLRREAAERNVDPERLIFARTVERREDHYARHRFADLFLDTLPYNAHTTACDALWAGVPVLTCRGKAFAGRVAASLLHAVGMADMVTADLDEYRSKAVTLAKNPSHMQSLRRRLEDRAGLALFDTRRFCRNIEAAFATMIDISRRGESPRSFSVGQG